MPGWARRPAGRSAWLLFACRRQFQVCNHRQFSVHAREPRRESARRGELGTERPTKQRRLCNIGPYPN